MYCTPRLSILDANAVSRVHDVSLEILSSVGIEVHSSQARTFFLNAGASIKQGNRIAIPPHLVEEALQSAPPSIQIYSQDGQPAFQLNDRQPHFGIGVTNLYYQDPTTDQIIPFQRKHMETSVRLGNSLDEIDCIATVGILEDLPPSSADIYATLEMTANTNKPLILLVSEPDLFSNVLELLTAVGGNLAERPAYIPYVNPITPLQINRETSDKMIAAIERGMPIIYSVYGMAGMTTPITPAGTLALLNAELLAGLTLSQLIQQGAPIILGTLPMFFEMKEMEPAFDPHSFALNAACAEMMAHYQLPHCGTSGSGEGWGADILNAGAVWANQITSCLSEVGLCPFVGSSFGSLVFSPLSAVYADDVIAQAKRLAERIDLSPQALSLSVIQNAIPEGDFLSSEQTYNLFREAYFPRDVFPLLSLDQWQEQGSPRAVDFLRERTEELIAHPQIPGNYQETIDRGQKYIQQSQLAYEGGH